MPTATRAQLAQTIRTRLLTFADTGGATLADLIGERLWIDWPPDTAQYPYGVLTLTLTTGGADGQVRAAGIAEVMLYGRGAANRRTLSDAGDLAVRALTRWHVTTDADDGAVKIVDASAQSVPTPGDPADRELLGVRVAAGIVTYPAWLAPA